jgi:hypothetical protein
VRLPKLVLYSLIFTLLGTLSGCSLMVSSATSSLADNLSHSILNQQDPDTVKVAIPSYLLLMDAMIIDSPDDINLLRSAATLNTAYAGLFIEDKERQQVIADKAMDYATRAVCNQTSEACEIRKMPFEKFEKIVAKMNLDKLPSYYTLGSTWAIWVQANSSDWNAIAQLSRIESIMQKALTLDENYDHGGAHIYLGILSTLLPPAMGGHPEVGKKHFERSIELSQGKNLMARVTYAERYARLMFDRDLHDRLLRETLKAETKYEDLTLINTIAKQKARQLLASANDYF